ncbi:MAG: amino acid permease, partial [Steroidobacteraceae bacterium]
MAQGKELGFWMCTALVVGNTIGIGIYVLPASLAPYGFNALAGWAITVVGMTFLARIFAQLAREFPSADGPQTYIERTSGSLAAFVAIWCFWISVFVTNAAIAIGLVGYLSKVVPALQGVSPALQSLALIWLFTGINLLGVRAGGGVQVVTTALKLLPMLFTVGLGAGLLLSEPAVYVQHPPATPVTLEG